MHGLELDRGLAPVSSIGIRVKPKVWRVFSSKSASAPQEARCRRRIRRLYDGYSRPAAAKPAFDFNLTGFWGADRDPHRAKTLTIGPKTLTPRRSAPIRPRFLKWT
jgi:hypothetical protein